MKKIIDFAAAKKEKEKAKHAELVINAFDNIMHIDNRAVKEAKAEARRKARNNL